MTSNRDTTANILLLGRTGEGKSSFINYILQSDVCKVSDTEPCTMAYDCYDYTIANDMPIRIYDSRGLETKDFETIKDELTRFISERCNSDNIFNWLHAIFYCKNLKRGRFEPQEFELIKSLSKDISQSIHIIITNCPQEETTELSEMKQHIRKNLGSDVIISCVNSVETKTRVSHVPAFGREKILDDMFTMLWTDISSKVSTECARDITRALSNMVDEFEDTFDRMCDEISLSRILSQDDSLADDMGRILDSVGPKMNSIQENAIRSYKTKVTPLSDFYNNYTSSLNCSIRNVDVVTDCFSNIFDIDFEFDNTRLGKAMNDVESSSGLEAFLRGASVVLRIKSLTREICNDWINCMRHQIPSQKMLQKRIYQSMMEQIKSEVKEDTEPEKKIHSIPWIDYNYFSPRDGEPYYLLNEVVELQDDCQDTEENWEKYKKALIELLNYLTVVVYNSHGLTVDGELNPKWENSYKKGGLGMKIVAWGVTHAEFFKTLTDNLWNFFRSDYWDDNTCMRAFPNDYFDLENTMISKWNSYISSMEDLPETFKSNFIVNEQGYSQFERYLIEKIDEEDLPSWRLKMFPIKPEGEKWLIDDNDEFDKLVKDYYRQL